MEYQKQNFQDGEILKAERLNHMENGIAEVARCVCNPNLLDNWYFADPINQRGKTTYSGVGYAIDRWCFDGNATITLNDNGTITITSNEDYPFWGFFQPIEKLQNVEMTGSIFVTDFTGEPAIVLQEYQSDTYDTVLNMGVAVGLVSGTGTPHTGNKYRFGMILKAGESVTVSGAKLELGCRQTLARQENGEWVLNDAPPNRQQELAKCQRYFQTFATQSLRPTDEMDFRPVMRVTPALGTISVNGKTLYTASADL